MICSEVCRDRGGIQVTYDLSMQQLKSGCTEKVTRLEMRDGFAAQGKVQPASRTGCGMCWEPGQEVVAEEALPRDRGSRPYQQGATQRRQEAEATCTEGQRGKLRAVLHEWSQHIPTEPTCSLS